MDPGSMIEAARAALIAGANPAIACSPLVPLMKVVAGPNLLMASALGLALAVTVKCAAFAAFERSMPWYRSVALLLVANLVSTVMGAVVAVAVGVPISIVVNLGVIFLLSIIPAGAFLRHCEWDRLRGWSAPAFAALIVAVVFVSWVFFVAAQVAGDSGALALYWVLKVAFVFAALVVSMALTTVWEGGVVLLLSGLPRRARAERAARRALRREGTAAPGPAANEDPGAAIFRSVLKANLVAFAAVGLIAAVMMIPERLQYPDLMVPAVLIQLAGGAL